MALISIVLPLRCTSNYVMPNPIIDIYSKSFKGMNKDIWLFATVMFVNRMGTLILPFITLYTTQEIGWTKVQAGMAVSCFGLGSLVGSYLGGWLTDKIGYYKVFIWSLALGGTAFWTLQYLTDYVLLCIGLFLASSIADVIRPALFTGLRYFTDESTQTRAISMMRMAFNLGFAIGPAIGGAIIALTSYKWIFILDAITCWLAAIMAFYLIEDRSAEQLEKSAISKEKGESTNPYTDIPYMLFLFFNFLMLVSFFQILFTVPLYLEEVILLGAGAIGIFFSINGIMVFFLEMPLVYFVEKKWKTMPAMIVGAAMIGIATLVLLIPSALWVALAVYMLLVSVGEIINFPFISTMALNRATDSNSGKMMALSSVMFSLSLIAAPIIGTGILDRFGYNILWWSMAALCFVACIGLWYLRPYFEVEGGE